MAERSFWLDLFTGQTWQEFLNAGGSVSGFRASRRSMVKKMKQGDYLLCYLTGVSRFIGVLEVTGPAFTDSKPIWKDEDFPERVPVSVVHKLTPATGVPVSNLLDAFSWSGLLKSPFAWTGHFRSSPARWEPVDGEMVLQAIADAVTNPVERPVDKAKLARRPRGTKSSLGPVIVPDAEPEDEEAVAEEVPPELVKAHTEIQYLLLQLGGSMGLDLWVAKNDRGRTYKGKTLGEMPGVRSQLPLKFDPVTNKTIELIDVLWLKANAIVAAFEVESTTVIYSGLLRMADLIALQPNLKIPLYIVAPDDKRDKVFSEVNRPTFRRLDPPMAEVTRYIAFSALREGVEKTAPFLKFLKPDFIEDIAETVDIEDE